MQENEFHQQPCEPEKIGASDETTTLAKPLTVGLVRPEQRAQLSHAQTSDLTVSDEVIFSGTTFMVIFNAAIGNRKLIHPAKLSFKSKD